MSSAFLQTSDLNPAACLDELPHTSPKETISPSTVVRWLESRQQRETCFARSAFSLPRATLRLVSRNYRNSAQATPAATSPQVSICARGATNSASLEKGKRWGGESLAPQGRDHCWPRAVHRVHSWSSSSLRRGLEGGHPSLVSSSSRSSLARQFPWPHCRPTAICTDLVTDLLAAP